MIVRFDDLFLRILDLTKSGTLVILAVVLLRLFLRKAPKICSYVLWAVVLFRLLCPVSLEAPWAILPEVETGETYTLVNDEIDFIGAAGAAVRAVGDAANGGLGIQHIRTVDREVVTSNWWEVWVLFGKYVWLAGLLFMVIYAMCAYWKLKKQLRLSIPLMEPHWSDAVVKPPKPDVFLADGIQTAFVVGLFRPKIFLPSDLTKSEREYILLHERHHIKRGDQLWKLLGFAALCVHWFNPLVWIAFRLAETDMEMSCDEAVLRQLGEDIRKDYSVSLLRLAAGKRVVPQMPLAFGEGDTGDRVRHVMKYKKPAIAVTACVMVLVLAAVVFLSANEAAGNTEVLASVYRTDLIVYSSDGIGGPTESGPMYAVSADHQLYRKNLEAEPWNHLGTLTPYDLTNRELKEYTDREKGWTTGYRLREITDAWYLAMENDMFYLVFQTKNGDTLLSYGWEDMGERWQGASDDTSLTFLYRLNPTGDAKSAMGLTMTSILGGPLDSWGTYRSGDYCVWAFSTGEEYKDWGYAVYKEYDGAFKLLDWHLYENAAFVQNDIYVCPDPAVLSDDGTMTDENTYDVILNCNMQLDRVVRTVTVDGEVHHTVEKENINGSSLILFNWADQDAPKPHSVSQHFYDKWGEKIEVSSMTQEDLMLAVFSQDYPNTAPVDWVLADDGAQDLLGVVIFSEKPGATEFAFVKNGHCARAGLGAAVCPESDLIYEGDATVSVVLQDDKADLYRMYLAYSVNEEKRETHFDHWAELIQASPMQTFTPQTEDEERLLNFFQKSIPNTEPVDWVAVNDDTSCFLGVVLYANESDHATLAFVREDACTMSVIRATVLPDSQLTYEGDGTVSVVLKGTNGITQRYYRQYTRSEDGIGISYRDWTEAAE